jgi:hypothetical protein
MAEHDPAQRPRKETHGVRGKRRLVPARGSRVGKKSWLKTSAAAVPYRKKSYHSIVVPMKLATTTRATPPAGFPGDSMRRL